MHMTVHRETASFLDSAKGVLILPHLEHCIIQWCRCQSSPADITDTIFGAEPHLVHDGRIAIADPHLPSCRCVS